MSLISFHNVYRAFGSQVVLDGASFAVSRSDHVGLIGRNGVGKSTLLRLIMGADRPDRGQVILQPRIRIGQVEQDPNLDPTLTVYQSVLDGRPELVKMEQELRRLEQALGDPDADHDAVLESYGELQHEFDRLGGHEFHGKAAAVLAGLGLPLDTHDRPVQVLSGGQKTRLALARLLLSDPDVLLLDEPTNHLDLEATEWLQAYLQRSQATLIVVSHDRYLLDAVCDHIVEVENGRTESYHGNYESYLTQKAERLEKQRETFERQQEEIQKLEAYIRRYKAGNRATMAKSREKMLARIEVVDKPRDSRAMKLRLGGVERSGHDVVKATAVTKRFGELELFRNLDLVIHRGDRLGLVGPNGAGKTTLIRMILGREQPTEGTLTLGSNVHVGYFSQDLQIPSGTRSVLEEILTSSELDIPAARSMLGRFLFTDEEVFKEVGSLSGGERNRVALCKLLLQRPNFLVLDEPTNHLDIATREGLVKALQEFKGTVLVASHDRYLLDRVTDRTLELADGKVHLYPGSYSEYRRQRYGEGEIAAPVLPAVRNTPPAGPTRSAKKMMVKPSGKANHPAPAPPKKDGKQPVSLPKLEKQIQELETRLSGLTERMNDPELYKSPDMMDVVDEYDRVRLRLEGLYQDWETLAEATTAVGS